MKKSIITIISGVITASALLGLAAPAQADTVPAPSTDLSAAVIAAPSVKKVSAHSVLVTWRTPTNPTTAILAWVVDIYKGNRLMYVNTSAAGPAMGDGESVTMGATVTGLAALDGYTATVTYYSGIDPVTGGMLLAPESVSSNVVNLISVPLKVAGTKVSTTKSSVVLSWRKPDSDGSAIISYTVKVLRGASVVKTVKVAAASTRTTVPGLASGTGYAVIVVATNAKGNSPASSKAVFTTK